MGGFKICFIRNKKQNPEVNINIRKDSNVLVQGIILYWVLMIQGTQYIYSRQRLVGINI